MSSLSNQNVHMSEEDLIDELYKQVTTAGVKYIEYVSFEPENGLFEICENVIGIHKKRLIKLYLALKPQIKACYRDKSGEKQDLERSHRIMVLTFICLIITYENITAINRRRSVLLNANNHLIFQELAVINIILSSPLKKQTKSSIIWEHKRWLLNRCDLNDIYKHCDWIYSGALEYEREQSIRKRDIRTENLAKSHYLGYLELLQVFLSGHRHPANYYAYSHARWILNTYCLDPNLIAEMVFNQCKSKISDISRWSFLLYVIEKSENEKSRNGLIEKYIEKTEKLKELIPGHETIEWFLKWAGR